MKTLVIDTAFEQCQVGIYDGALCVASVTATGGGQHDRVLVPLLEKILTEAHLSLANLDRIFVTTGPGRFTGLRVGIAFARGLALVHDTPLYGISTVDALKQEWQDHQPEQASDVARHVLLVAVKRGETYALRMADETGATGDLQRVMDDDFVAHFSDPAHQTGFFGMISPELQEIISDTPHFVLFDAVRYPSLQSIFAVGNTQEFDKNAPVRPHYALD